MDEFRSRIVSKNLIIEDKQVLEQLLAFGLDAKGKYVSSMPHDDLAISCINIMIYFTQKDVMQYTTNTILRDKLGDKKLFELLRR